LPGFVALTGAAATDRAAILGIETAFVVVADEIAIGWTADVDRRLCLARRGNTWTFATDIIAAGVGARAAALATGELPGVAADAGRLVALARITAFGRVAGPTAVVCVRAAVAIADEAGCRRTTGAIRIAIPIAAAIGAAAILRVGATLIGIADEIAIGWATDL
jgi:hypothetical protein